MRLLWPVAVMSISTQEIIMAITRSDFVTGKVIENKAWTERLYTLKIRVKQLPFRAGQFVRLQLPVEGEALAKPCSLVNSSDKQDLEIYYNTVQNGQLSNELAALEVGDTIYVSQPAFGYFVLDQIPESKHLWMFATGTGVGPFISLLRSSEIWTRFEKIVLVHSVPIIEELTFAELTEKLQKEHPEQFQYLPCVTRENFSTGLNGRMTDLLVNGDLEKMAGYEINKESSQVMLCGNHNMINDMKTLLAERGMRRNLSHKPGNITTEQYF